MRLLISIIGVLIVLGCSNTPSPTKSEKSYTDHAYSFSITIPVISPSQFDTETLIRGGTKLVDKYKRANLVAYRDVDRITRLTSADSYPLTDDGWLAYLREALIWNVQGWNFDPGTNAHIYLQPGGLGVGYVGSVVFVKNGKRLGFDSLSGAEYLPDYYRDMKKLGIYIP